MKKLVLPDNVTEKPLVYYLAVEEYVARHLEDDVLFLWQTGPTVISGRNQVIEAEADLEYCKAHGIDVFRRKSGGGTVYSDKGNIMVSCIVSCQDVPYVFEKYLQTAALYLRSAGIDTSVSGRNDIIAGGRKVSGNAFYKAGRRGIIHGTMLFDTDFDMMEKALTPSYGKISSKGIRSVRQRVANISEFTDMSIGDFKAGLERFFCDGVIYPDGDFEENVEKTMQTYLDKDFLWGHEPEHTVISEGRTEAGNIEVMCDVKGGKIRRVVFCGDFFPLCEDPGAELTAVLSGVPFRREEIEAAIPAELPGKLIRGLGKEELTGLMFQ